MKLRKKTTLHGFGRFIYYVIPFTIIMDFFYFFIPIDEFIVKSPLAILKALMLYAFIIYIFVQKRIIFTIENRIIFWFSTYVIFLIPFSSDWLVSLRGSSSAIISLLMYTAARSMIQDIKDLKRLNKSVVVFMIVIVSNIAIANTFNIGHSDYTTGTDYLTGSLKDSYNIFTYSLLVLPIILFFIKRKEKKIFIKILAVVSVIMLILTLKRIAIAGIIFGYAIYFFYTSHKANKIKVTILVALILIALFPFYNEVLLFRYQTRAESGVFTENFYEKESRYLETIMVWEEILSFEEPLKSLFGLDPFNSVGKYGFGQFGRRVIHVDYNLIVFTLGLVGLFLYLLIYFRIYTTFKKYSKSYIFKDYIYVNEIIAVFYALFFTSLVTSLAGQMQHIAFRNIIFIYLGGIINILKNISIEKGLTQKLDKKVFVEIESNQYIND